MTEQLALEQRVANCRGVKRNERLARARRRVVDGVSEESFACAGLAKQNYWNVRFRCQRCQLQATSHGLIACGQVFDPESGARLLHGNPRNYCFMLSRNCRIGSKAYSISVRPPTMIFACPLIPTRRGKTSPVRGDIS